MALPTLAETRKLSEWRPPFGAISVYLGFDPADRSDEWHTMLRNGVDRILALAENAGHERKMALRETAKRLLERFEPREVRPPPRGAVGFVEVSRDGARERWWGSGVAPLVPGVVFGDRPVVTELVDLRCRTAPVGVALLSADRVRLLHFTENELEAIDEWELTILSLDWRERKAQRTSDPARAQGVSSSGHDQYGERLEHNRKRFLGECGRRARERVEERGLGEIVAFGPRPDVEAFDSALASTPIEVEDGGDADLITAPAKAVIAAVTAAVGRRAAERERAVAERALDQAHGGSRGAAGVQETAEALVECRVEHLVLDPAAGAPAETLVRGALAGDAEITIVHDGSAELLRPAEGVAAILRY